MLAIVTSEDMELHQMNVKTAFSNGDLSKDIDMEQPKSFFSSEKATHLRQLQKALHRWNKHHDNELRKLTPSGAENFSSRAEHITHALKYFE